MKEGEWGRGSADEEWGKGTSERRGEKWKRLRGKEGVSREGWGRGKKRGGREGDRGIESVKGVRGRILVATELVATIIRRFKGLY